MRILLFGTGDYYQKYRRCFKSEEIEALIDNDTGKQGCQIDGYKVVSPEEVIEMDFDCIVILSVHETSMRRQLVELGVSDERIYKFSELHRHPEILDDRNDIEFLGNDEFFSKIMDRKISDTILLMSHNLDLNGASLALFYAARILKANGYSVLFVSWTDGPLKTYIREAQIPVVVDTAMQIKTYLERDWLHGFQRIICNTINYYHFLSERDEEVRILWWLHDPAIFYQSLDLEQLRKVSEKNMTICAVGSIAEKAFKNYFPHRRLQKLLYGIPDIMPRFREHRGIEIVTIGNVQDYKGQDILVAALKRLSRDMLEKIHVSIIGSQQSAYAAAVKKAAEGLEQVSFLPAVNREKIHKILDGADLLVCPSRMDSMPVVVSEGLQHGLPCIVSNATGIATYINDGIDGFVVKSEDVDQLSSRLGWCINHPVELKSMGKKARLIYERYFSMEIFEDNLLRMLQNIL